MKKDKQAIKMELDIVKSKIVIDGCCKVCSEINIPKEREFEHANKDCGKCVKCSNKDEMVKLLSGKIKSMKTIRNVTEFNYTQREDKYASKQALENHMRSNHKRKFCK